MCIRDSNYIYDKFGLKVAFGKTKIYMKQEAANVIESVSTLALKAKKEAANMILEQWRYRAFRNYVFNIITLAKNCAGKIVSYKATAEYKIALKYICLLYTSPSPRDS
eukprot:TRINITY_DN19039_c0_g1_i1.p2 TRINITY_DN19039_c0_g1~~TRINITY_DN19039_c0_g1_i1.p2  ORF type:complete len:108 (+),score=29.35 TRINITY_DN19039_c0_g1_i1:62-385(+)